MNINTALSAVDKLYDYVKSIHDDKDTKTLYKKSKIKLFDIRRSCIDIFGMITDIMEDGALTDGDEVQQDISNMLDRVDKLRAFTSPTVGQQMASVYTADSQISDPTYCDCFALIKDWYTCRFITSLKINPQYTYKSDWVLQWTEDIVIGYGKHLHNGNLEDYYDMFNLWKSKVLDPTNPSRYSVPYEVYNYNVGLTESDCTLEALLLWDDLCSHNLSKLIKTPLSMYNRFARLSDIVDEYDKMGAIE